MVLRYWLRIFCFDHLCSRWYASAASLSFWKIVRSLWASREFFTKYQDRVVFGKDAYEPSEYPYYFRVFETNDEYFDYYRKYHANWKLYGMGLPDQILKKFYYQNALKVVPGLPQNGWTK